MFTLDEPAPPRTQAALPGLPPRAGLGLKTGHFREVLGSLPDLGFFEVHAENYMVDGGPFHHFLGLIREQYPLSLHGVGLSIGAEGPLDTEHLKRLAGLIERYQPQSFSEHLAWSSHGPVFLNDLLPLAYDTPTLNRVCAHIDQVQNTLKRPMLLENPATYLAFQHSTLDEADFISEVIRRSGCGLLLDVNNVYVSCINHQRDPQAYLNALPLHAVGEIHLAGFAEDCDSLGDRLLIDDHGAPVDQTVWTLYRQALERIGPVATLIERDNQVPAFNVLLAEARQADEILLGAGVRS
ncbi:MNIO family bufferin maturase [Pseudomonas monsensis]